MAYCSVTVDAGSRDERDEEHGLAHFAEHSLFKGTRRRRAWHINSRLEKLGGELNAFTSKEETVVHSTTLLSDLPKATELISDVLFNSVFPDNEIEKEREVVLEEIGYYKDSPAEMIYDEFEDMLFAGSDLGHNILGNESSVASFTGSVIDGFVKRCYNTDRMVVAVSADIDEKAFARLVERDFGDKPICVRGFERSAPMSGVKFETILSHNTHQTHCIIGNRAYSSHNQRRTALSLLVNILGGPAANSMLNTLLREKHGYTYNIEANYTPYCDTGVSTIYFGCDRDKADRCVELVAKTIKKLASSELSTLQLSQAQKQYVGQLSIAMENREGYMLGVGKSLLVYDKVDSAEDIYKRITSVTSHDIMAAANDVFVNTSILRYDGDDAR